MKAVIDTNVLVSGLLTPMGPCGEIIRLLAAGAFTTCFSPSIIAEYFEVLQRSRFRFDPARVAVVLADIQRTGVASGPLAVCPDLPDADDRPFLEAALSGDAACIVTGNTTHFPVRLCRPADVVDPAAFLKQLSTSGK